MGRLSEYFDQHRDNVEEAVSQALKKADSTIESLSAKVKELERKMRDVAGGQPQEQETELERQRREQEEANKPENAQTENPEEPGVVRADKTARKRAR